MKQSFFNEKKISESGDSQWGTSNRKLGIHWETIEMKRKYLALNF